MESRTFVYQRVFGERPSDASDQVWQDMFPEQGGFFRHPNLAPKRSALSVFHQLHCLNGIRQGYWALYDKATAGARVTEDDLPMMSSPSHIRHCIDLLRNALMCKADTTIEVKNETLGGVTGFGTEHRCVQWDVLMNWVSDWEAYGQDPETSAKAAEQHLHGTALSGHSEHESHDMSSGSP
ncbi:MAG: hypothetical protein Q9162_005142 [Coniocarpon cinnabarinum]